MDSALKLPPEPEKPAVPEESAQELYEDAPCGYLSLLPDGTILRANRTFLRWTGYTPDELFSGTRLQDLLPVPVKVFYETHYAPLLRMQGFLREMAHGSGMRQPAGAFGAGERHRASVMPQVIL